MNNVFIIAGYIIVALIVYFILVYKDLSIDCFHEVHNVGDADNPANVIIAIFWPIAIAVVVCAFPFWGCYKLAFKLKKKLNPREIKPNSLNEGESDY